MQKNSITGTANKVKITFSKRKMTAYGGFALLASFFERIGFAEMIEKTVPIEEYSPNSMGIYGKIIAFVGMVYAGAERFSHLIYLGNKDVIARLFGVKRLPDAATTITRMFNKLTTVKAADALSRNVWSYLSQLIPSIRPYFGALSYPHPRDQNPMIKRSLLQAKAFWLARYRSLKR